jgi:N-acetylneuraminic acid mutarotase
VLWHSREIETTGEVPQQRANHSSALLEETAELFIFGGWNGNERLNDIHILDTNTSTWTRPRVGGELPHPRAGMTLTALRGRLFLFGGSGTPVWGVGSYY